MTSYSLKASLRAFDVTDMDFAALACLLFRGPSTSVVGGEWKTNK